MLTATPINNSMLDLQHLIELFSRRQADYFKVAPLGIHSLPGHFRALENAVEKLLERVADIADRDHVNRSGEGPAKDAIYLRELVVQRSRAYAKRSQQQHSGVQVIFPRREIRKLPYSLKQMYGTLLDHVERGFDRKKPLLSLGPLLSPGVPCPSPPNR